VTTTSYGSLSWVGQGFGPGAEHYWWSTPADYGSVVAITAHAVARIDREIEVKDVRTHVDERGGRSMQFTVRNTGLNTIPGYLLAFSYVNS
jgi:hypothetical protein